ncbi:MAG: hypothetical protein KF805_11085 [Phycisphaeraceae bacterium]|nr:hypothetical protein [Phycisphaeraceae bacterium]
MRFARFFTTIAVAAVSATCVAEPVQEESASVPPPESKPEDQSLPLGAARPEWRFQFEPSAWYAGASGKVRIAGAPAGTSTVRINDLHLDNPILTPSGELSVRTGNWRFGLGTFFFSQNRLQTMAVPGQLGSVTFAAGQQVNSKMEQDEYMPVVGYEFWRRDPESSDAVKVLGRLEAFGGARLDDVKFSFSQGAAAASQSEFFGQAIIGIKGSMDIAEQFSIDLETSVGGWPGSSDYAWSWDITVGFMWRPIPNVGIQAGYRNLVNELRRGNDSQEFYYNGGLAGLFFGAVVRF